MQTLEIVQLPRMQKTLKGVVMVLAMRIARNSHDEPSAHLTFASLLLT